MKQQDQDAANKINRSLVACGALKAQQHMGLGGEQSGQGLSKRTSGGRFTFKALKQDH